jgi:ribose transport system ATP-binding protein
MPAALLTIEHLSKSFPGQVALDDARLVVKAGTTHALVGQNGSGKSTLIKILAGYHQPTGHEATAIMDLGSETRPLRLGDSTASEQAGIRFVHQDLGLVDGLNTIENLAMSGGFVTRFGRIDWQRSQRHAEQALADLGFDDFSVLAPVGTLAPSQKTAVAVARALQGWEDGANLLVLDEPTASLPGADVHRLFDAIRLLKTRGVAILYVSHHLDEVFAIADEVTVLRDGRNVITVPTVGLDHDTLIQHMIGRDIERGRSVIGDSDGDTRLAARGLRGGSLHGIDLQVRAGEVVGVAGITGSGRESLAPLITGHVPHDAGTVEVNGRDVPTYAPAAVLAAGMAFLAADRLRHGVIPLMSVTENTTLGSLRRHLHAVRIHRGREAVEVDGWIDRLSIKTSGRAAVIATLSGGNQQKVLFARGLRLEPTVIVIDEPTRGIDVGAKEEIHLLIDKAAAGGAAVLVVSTDTDELVRLSHRVLILRGGQIAVELAGRQISQENIERGQLAGPSNITVEEHTA